jgi:DNA-directed RNA polymerase subunit RPC12/RpoP
MPNHPDDPQEVSDDGQKPLIRCPNCHQSFDPGPKDYEMDTLPCPLCGYFIPRVKPGTLEFFFDFVSTVLEKGRGPRPRIPAKVQLGVLLTLLLLGLLAAIFQF